MPRENAQLNANEKIDFAREADAIDARFDAALKARRIDLEHPTPESVDKLRAIGKDPDAAFAVMNEAGMSKDALRAGVETFVPKKLQHPLITGSAVGGTLGAALGIAATPVVNWSSQGRASWQAFVKGMPKATAVGFAIGAVVGIGAAYTNNQRRELELESANREIDRWGEEATSRKLPGVATNKSGRV